MGNTDTQDLAEHQLTYDRFVRLTKWTTISVVVLLILMALFLVRH